jgi:hypothetical protein
MFGRDAARLVRIGNIIQSFYSNYAGLCSAILRNTACVFHCMRVLEKGLISLANELRVPFVSPF